MPNQNQFELNLPPPAENITTIDQLTQAAERIKSATGPYTQKYIIDLETNSWVTEGDQQEITGFDYLKTAPDTTSPSSILICWTNKSGQTLQKGLIVNRTIIDYRGGAQVDGQAKGAGEVVFINQLKGTARGFGGRYPQS